MLNIKIRDKRNVKEVYEDSTYLGEEVLSAESRGDGDNKTDEPDEPKPKMATLFHEFSPTRIASW